jgi:hypothetical protein
MFWFNKGNTNGEVASLNEEVKNIDDEIKEEKPISAREKKIWDLKKELGDSILYKNGYSVYENENGLFYYEINDELSVLKVSALDIQDKDGIIYNKMKELYDEEEKIWVEGYKRIPFDMVAKGLKYEMGKEYSVDFPILCVRGFHFSNSARETVEAYSARKSKLFKVKAYVSKKYYEKCIKDGDWKIVASKIILEEYIPLYTMDINWAEHIIQDIENFPSFMKCKDEYKEELCDMGRDFLLVFYFNKIKSLLEESVYDEKGRLLNLITYYTHDDLRNLEFIKDTIEVMCEYGMDISELINILMSSQSYPNIGSALKWKEILQLI